MKNDMKEEIKLYTERLTVRTPSVHDATDIFELMKDKETALITGFTPMGDISEAEGKIRQSLTNENLFVITANENPKHIFGVFEISCQKVSTTQGEKQQYSICYFLQKDFRGKGYMTEVMSSIRIETVPSSSSIPYVGQSLKHGTVMSHPDECGFFTIEFKEWDDTLELNCIAGSCNLPSLYRGLLC